MPTLYSVACARFAHSSNETRSHVALRMTVSVRSDAAQLHAAGFARKPHSDGFVRRPMRSSRAPTRTRGLLECVRQPDVVGPAYRIRVRRVVADLPRERLVREGRCAVEHVLDAD